MKLTLKSGKSVKLKELSANTILKWEDLELQYGKYLSKSLPRDLFIFITSS